MKSEGKKILIILQLSALKTFMPDVNAAQLVWSLWEFVLYINYKL